MIGSGLKRPPHHDLPLDPDRQGGQQLAYPWTRCQNCCVEPLLSPARVYLDTVPARSHPRHRDVAAHVDTFEHGLDRHLWADESRLRIEHGDLVIRYHVCGVQAPDLGSVEDLRLQGVLASRRERGHHRF